MSSVSRQKKQIREIDYPSLPFEFSSQLNTGSEVPHQKLADTIFIDKYLCWDGDQRELIRNVRYNPGQKILFIQK
jgi:hypothetical protein